MLFKLIKYEWKAMMRSLMPIYGAALILSVINSIVAGTDVFVRMRDLLNFGFVDMILSLIQVCLAIFYAIAIIGIFIMTTVVSVQRFYKGLLKDEGYLMFTLPVKVWQLTLSKALVTFFAEVISIIVIIMAIGLMSAGDFLRGVLGLLELPSMIIMEINEALQKGNISVSDLINIIIFIVEFLLMALASSFAGIYQFYAAMALGQISRVQKVGFSILWYLVISVALTVIFYVFAFSGAGFINAMGMDMDMHPLVMLHIIFGGMLGYMVLMLGALVFITNFALSRRLNLE